MTLFSYLKYAETLKMPHHGVSAWHTVISIVAVIFVVASVFIE